jgi:hypothetical protein
MSSAAFARMRAWICFVLVAGCAGRESSPDDLELRFDDRDCVAPACGGVWLRAVDGHDLTCPSNVTSTDHECYVGTLTADPQELASQLPPNGTHVVRGRIEATGIGFGDVDWGRFVLTAVE